MDTKPNVSKADAILANADNLRWSLPANFHDQAVEAIYGEAAAIARRNVQRSGEDGPLPWERRLDRLLTNRWTGFPLMALLLGLILWFTILGANVPSGLLDDALVGFLYPQIRALFEGMGAPWWLTGLLVDGVYLTTAWVIAVMLPPMAIFFPLFTLLEDFGYLPRVAFNLDRLFQRAGAHGKQALTMAMGFGCNAAAIVSTRIIDSPREKLIAILTNNFSLCNGRWPTQILIATIFIGALVPPAIAGATAAAAVLLVCLTGIGLALAVSWALSRTVLKGTASTFSLELPPYRPPRIWQTLYTSLIDRTIFVLWRAIVFAAPAGVLIWGSANLMLGDQSLAEHLIYGLDPVAWLFGLTGVILLAYVVAIPANEIVIPTILMLTALVLGPGAHSEGRGVMFELDSLQSTADMLTSAGWTPLTAICLMLFSLCHNPCSTTLYTIYKETHSLRWTALAALIPTAIGLALCATIALLYRAAF